MFVPSTSLIFSLLKAYIWYGCPPDEDGVIPSKNCVINTILNIFLNVISFLNFFTNVNKDKLLKK